MTTTARRRALWISTSLETRGGIASYVRAMQQTPLWVDWEIRHVATHRDGSVARKIAAFGSGTVLFVVELIRFRPSVIHLHSSAGGSFVRKAVLLWISRPARVPVVLHMHGSAFQEEYERRPRMVQTMIRATLCRAAAFVTLGQVWASRMRDIVPSARIVAIPNAVRPARRGAQPSSGHALHVVFLGRVGEHKGTFRLLDAWAKLVCDPGFSTQRGHLATLTIAGDGEVERARSHVRDLGVSDTVDVHDWLSETAVGELLDRAQILVLPSQNEGQPMAVLEAMARGLCVIASDVGGLSEMIGGECGMLIPPNDTEAIAAALRAAVYDRALRVRYGAAARARIRDRFDIDVVAHRLDALYREVCR
ncbi:Glycosyltransferase involved in cell wall bisynthesis [Mycolicibacterium fluoranthenivorans]|uniref:Glycosyltransferase involved in cell wall bisynthesis n=2 Tax=Mycolicibacterium fluoranthenivorans TaxID=258505 RepID=A0A1G4VI21_9MYCO|nr:Glycosyltransferase involved in cell wall bisynthesis [Mycolicibacterium fluoranthenivorans]